MISYPAPLLARIPPPVWTALYVAMAMLADGLLPQLRFEALRIPLLGGIIAAMALVLAVWAALLFKRYGTQIFPASRSNAHVVEDGPYSFTRNPMYLALVLLTAGIAFRYGGLPLFLVPVAVFYTNDRIVIPYEEHKMEAQHGDRFRSYMNRVRRWI